MIPYGATGPAPMVWLAWRGTLAKVRQERAVRSNGELGGDVRIGKRFVQLMRSPRDIYEVLQGPGLEVQRRFGISRVQQVRQVLRYKRRLGAMREEYYKYEFYRPEMSEDAKDRYVMQCAWDALSDVLNRSERNLDRSKLLQSRRFAEANIPTPRTLGYTAYAPTEHQRAAPEFFPLSELPRVAPAGGCVLKQERSKWGRGVLVFKSCDRGVFEQTDGRRFDIDGIGALLRERGGGFVVQERVTNHPELASLGLPSLTSLRVVTYGTGDNVRILRAAMKLPIGLKGVDNYVAGSVAAPVDLDSGKVGRGAAKFVMEWVSSHPETGKRFEGMTVPCWNEVLAVSRQVAKSMPDVRCVGWDVAVTTDGVRIIEGNCSWGTGLIQRPHCSGIWEGEFKDWCLENVRTDELPQPVRRWLGL